MNILLLTNELRYTCGVTNHLLHLSRGLTGTGKVNLWIICGGGNGVNRFSDINVNIITDERFLHLTRTFSGFISSINFLVKFIRQNKIDVIHSHYHYGAAIAKRASRLTGITTIQTNHGLLADTGRLKHFNADRYIAINGHIKDHLLKNKIAAERNITFIRCGIPSPDKLQVKNEGYIIKVLGASRFAYGKGLDIFIKAVSLLPEEILKKAEFVIAGEGELEEKLKKLNEAAGGRIKFPGKVTDMYSYLKNIHVLVNPTCSDEEGFPAIITEAGASNTLVISSDFNGHDDVLQNRVNSLIYKSDSPEELSELLKKVITGYKDYQPAAGNLYNKIKTEFSIDEMISKHILLYTECLKK